MKIIRPRNGGAGFYRACPKCEAELDLAAGEWVPALPARSTHGYRISQLISSKVDPGEILDEYRTTRYPERFYNLKVGIAWADLERRLDTASVLALCGDGDLTESSAGPCVAGVDTGKALHTVVLEQRPDKHPQLVHLAEYRDFRDLDDVIRRFHVDRLVIDAYPETYATREFALRHRGVVFMCQFVDSQRGGPNWDWQTQLVTVNRTDALDASRAVVREKTLTLPRQQPSIEEFATHMTADAKVLDEDAETGAKRYRYIKTGTNHYSFALTYAMLAFPELYALDLSYVGWV